MFGTAVILTDLFGVQLETHSLTNISNKQKGDVSMEKGPYM